jgi:glycosyltransferase involved in cell wall biosynthesis
MRICHIIETAGGGSGQVVVDLARECLAAGDDLTVIYAPNRAEPSFVNALSSMPGLRLVTTRMRREVSAHDFMDAWCLYRCLRRTGPFDVIHGHSSKAGALARISGLFFPKAIKVYTPHAFVTMAPQVSCLFGTVEKILSLLCDAVIVASHFEKEHALKRIGINKRKVAVISNGVQMSGFSDRAAARRELGYQNSEFVFGFVGRLSPQKNPLRLIEAFIFARRQRPDLKLAIVGEGPLQAAIEETIVQRGLARHARFFPGKKGRNVVSGFDGLLCSSDYEGFPIVFLEALAASVPIVTTRVGGALESVVEGQTGFVADDFSVESLALAMLKLIALDSENRTRMVKHARAHARQFGIETAAAGTRALYQCVAERKRKRYRMMVSLVPRRARLGTHG